MRPFSLFPPRPTARRARVAGRLEAAEPATLARLAGEAGAADAVLLGDYHGFAPAQENLLLLARALSATARPFSIALEAFAARSGPSLERFARGEISEEALLRRCGQASRWPFDLRGLRRILRFARSERRTLFGIDVARVSRRETIRARERALAGAIERALRARAPRPILVLVGESHLPGLARLLRRRRVLAVSFAGRRARGGGRGRGIVRRGARAFALGGFAEALAEAEFLDRTSPPDDPADRVAELAEDFARRLGARRPDPSTIAVVVDADATRREGVLASFARGHLLVRSPEIAPAAEAALLALAGGAEREAPARAPLERFLAEARGAALRFCAARLLDPGRDPRRPAHFLPGGGPASARSVRGLAALREGIRRWLGKGSARPLRLAWSRAGALARRAAARSLGEVLGACLASSPPGPSRRAICALLLDRRRPGELARGIRRALLRRPRRAC